MDQGGQDAGQGKPSRGQATVVLAWPGFIFIVKYALFQSSNCSPLFAERGVSQELEMCIMAFAYPLSNLKTRYQAHPPEGLPTPSPFEAYTELAVGAGDAMPGC